MTMDEFRATCSRAILLAEKQGLLKIVVQPNGEIGVQVTPKGRAKVEEQDLLEGGGP